MTVLVHLHGLVFTAWLALFIAQTRLIAAHRVDLHMKLGHRRGGAGGGHHRRWPLDPGVAGRHSPGASHRPHECSAHSRRPDQHRHVRDVHRAGRGYAPTQRVSQAVHGARNDRHLEPGHFPAHGGAWSVPVRERFRCPPWPRRLSSPVSCYDWRTVSRHTSRLRYRRRRDHRVVAVAVHGCAAGLVSADREAIARLGAGL